jgi:hypothetical protein
MRRQLVLLSSAALMAACSSGPLGDRNAPDEFAVITKPPLTVPPDYALEPPRPGETRPEELSTTQRTQQLLLGDQSSEPPSNGELALVSAVGALDVDPSIRAILAAENGGRAEKSDSLTTRLLFWDFNGGEIDDSRAPLVVDDREDWLEARRRSIASVTGEDSGVVIATDDRGILQLPGVK